MISSAEGRNTDRDDWRDHSDIGVTLNVYTHLGFDDTAEEMERIQKAEEIREETPPKEEVTQKIFKVVQYSISRPVFVSDGGRLVCVLK